LKKFNEKQTFWVNQSLPQAPLLQRSQRGEKENAATDWLEQGRDGCSSMTLSHGGAGDINWSTYGFVVNRIPNSLNAERAKKLAYNRRLILKIEGIHYENEAFQWDDDAEGLECVKRVLTNNQRSRFNVEAVLKYF